MNKKELVLSWINARKQDNEKPINCIFQFTTPKYHSRLELEKDDNICKLTNILDKYDIKWDCVDTISGSYNLNRDWIETTDIPCYVEYPGVYPVDWDIEDVLTLENMDYDGKLIIKVLWHTDDGKFVSNH